MVRKIFLKFFIIIVYFLYLSKDLKFIYMKIKEKICCVYQKILYFKINNKCFDKRKFFNFKKIIKF